MNDLRRAAERLLEALDDGWVQRDDWVAFALRQALDQTKNQIPTTLCGPNLEQTLNAAGFYRQREWDTSDMAHRSGGLSVEQSQHPLDIYERAYFAGKQDGIDETEAIKRIWVGLTDEEIAQTVGSPLDEVYLADFRRVIAKLKERNT